MHFTPTPTLKEKLLTRYANPARPGPLRKAEWVLVIVSGACVLASCVVYLSSCG